MSCSPIPFTIPPWVEFILIELGLIAFLTFLGIFISKKIHNGRERITYIIVHIVASLGFFFFATVGIGILFIMIFNNGVPPSAEYHVLNAAIKNTCYLDPQRNHCPHSVDELIAIEPEHFKSLTQNDHLTYQYYPETNQYTLIVRNYDLDHNYNSVVIYDPRLVTATKFGYKGLDFYDAEVEGCNGHYKIKNPPPFPGPWDNI